MMRNTTTFQVLFFTGLVLAGNLFAGDLDKRAVTQVLRNYIDGPNEKNIEKLTSAFSESATIFYARDSKLVAIKLEDFFSHIESGWADGQEHLIVPREILIIDVFDNAAIAKIQANFPDGKAMDYISLLKIGGRWQIVNKIFSFK